VVELEPTQTSSHFTTLVLFELREHNDGGAINGAAQGHASMAG